MGQTAIEKGASRFDLAILLEKAEPHLFWLFGKGLLRIFSWLPRDPTRNRFSPAFKYRRFQSGDR